MVDDHANFLARAMQKVGAIGTEEELESIIIPVMQMVENDVLDRAAMLIGRKSMAGVIGMSDAMDACYCLKHRETVSS